LIDKTIKQRRFGSAAIYLLARRIVMAYENCDVDMATNGENWLQAKLGERGKVVAIDVGANQGEWATGLLRSVKDCHVYCYEPVPPTFGDLQRKIADTRVTLVNRALSSQLAKLALHSAIDNPYISSVYDIRIWQPDARVEDIEIEAVTGDDEIRRLGLTKLTIIKVDAEGHDADIIAGFRDTLASGNVEFVQFEYNALTLIGLQSLRRFYEMLGGSYVICRLLPKGLEAHGYHVSIDTFSQSNWVAVRNDIIDRDMVAMLRMRVAHGLPGEALRKQLANRPEICGVLGLN
jgi:FkbM family methyltransferase